MFTLALMALACEGISPGDDLAPMITDSSTPDGGMITLYEDDENAVWVNVYDEDMESLTYNWSLSLEGVLTQGVEELPEGSMVRLDYRTTYHDQELIFQVSDAWNTTTMSWYLNVPEAME